MIVGTAGHIDHGKTSLVRALTGIDTDRLKEEKARGISIDLGFAYLTAPDGGVLGFVDVPGHERFVHNMLAGASGIDFVLLVVAADDGIMPQTREHLAIVDLLGITRGLVALTKCDLADGERRAALAGEIGDLLQGSGIAGADIVPVSTVTGEGIDALRQRLFEAAPSVDVREAAGPFRLAVDRSFTLAGVGTVVTGTVLNGTVEIGDKVTISPGGLAARVRSIHAQNKAARRGVAGERCALNLAGDRISKDAIARGDMVMAPEIHAPSARIDAMLRLLPAEQKPVRQWMPARLHHAAVDVAARIVPLGDAPIAPGGAGLVQLVLDRPIAAAEGDRFVLRDANTQRTIGGGKFLDLRAPSRKRRGAERLAQLEARSSDDPAHALTAQLAVPPCFVDLVGFARDRVLSVGQVEALCEQVQTVRVTAAGGAYALSPALWQQFTRALVAALENFHAGNPDLPGIGIERLRLQLEPRLPALLFSTVLQGLIENGTIAVDGAWARLAAHTVRLTSADEKIWQRVLPLIRGNERFRPPRVRDLAATLKLREAELRRLFKLVARMGRVDEIAQDHFFLRATVAEMARIAVDLAEADARAEFSVAQFRDRLNSGRKVAIQVLEFFDRHGVTLRRDDVRRINRQRIDLFQVPAEPAAETSSGRESPPVGRPDFKSGRGREPVLGGFDSLSLPPSTRRLSR